MKKKIYIYIYIITQELLVGLNQRKRCLIWRTTVFFVKIIRQKKNF